VVRAALTWVAACGPVAALLVCTDGLSSYPRQAMRVFRQAERSGRYRRSHLVLPQDVLIAQAIKRYTRRRVRAAERRIIRGGAPAVPHLSSDHGRDEQTHRVDQSGLRENEARS